MDDHLMCEDQDVIDSALIVAIRRKRGFNAKKDDIVELLKDGANINAQSTDEKLSGYTPLHVAILADDTEIVKYLLTVDNVDPTITNNRKETPLALAQRLNKTEIIKALSAHCAKHEIPLKLFEEHKLLQHYEGIPVVNSDLIIKLAQPSSQYKPAQLPNDYVLSRLALATYRSAGQVQLLPKGWTLLTAERSGVEDSDYGGVAYWNRDQQQIVVAHWCNCNATDISKDKWSGFTFDDMVPIINATITFSHKILNLMNELNRSGLHFQLSLTGHSFGGWLAQIAAFSVKYLVKKEGDVYVVNENNTGYQAHTVVFDSPGCREALLETISRLNSPLTQPLIALDITTYVSAPNRVNTCYTHLGIVYRIFVDLTYAEQKSDKYNLASHSMERIAQCFDPNSGHVKLDDSGQLKIQKVLEWPKICNLRNVKEALRFYGWARKLNGYHAYPITSTFEDKVRYRTCEFNLSEFNMRLECHANKKRSDTCRDYYTAITQCYFRFIQQNQINLGADNPYVAQFLRSDLNVLHAIRYMNEFSIGGTVLIYHDLQTFVKENHEKKVVKESHKIINHLYFPLRQLLSFESDISFLKHLPKLDPDILILECQSDSEVQSFLNIDYSSLLVAPPKSKIILISDDIHLRNVRNKMTIGMPVNWSMQWFVENALVDFQGKKVRWSNVYQNVHSNMPMETELLGRKFKIGNELPSFHGTIDIQRTLTPLKFEFTIDASCFKTSKVDIFVISNISVEELQPLISPEETISLYQDLDETKLGCRFIILQSKDANSQFERLSAIHWPSKSVHWLHKVKFVKDFDSYNKCDEIMWRNSKGSFNELKFEDDHAAGQAAQCQRAVGWGASVPAKDITDQLVIVSGIDGMGKSTFLAQLALQIKDSDPTLWVVPIDLSTWVTDGKPVFESGPSPIEVERAIQVLNDVLKLTSDIEIQLFRDYVRNKDLSQAIVLIDGFDEIAAKHKRTVTDLVKTLKSMNIKQIWLSCRPISIGEFDINDVSYSAYMLDELTEEQQERLLSLYCRGHSDKKVKGMKFVELWLETNMLLTPLLMKMLVELSSQTISDIRCLKNIPDIYKSYITKTLQEVYGANHHSMLKVYQSMAVQVLFPRDYAQLLPDWAQNSTLKLLCNIEKGHQQSALLSGIVNGIPQFIHRTFAEYLAAQWFMDTLTCDSENVMQYNLKEPGNCELSKLHNETGKLNAEVESLRLRQIFELFVEDVLNGEYSLLSHVCKLNLNENFITRLKVFVDDERLQQLKANDENCELLHFAAKRGHLNLVRRLIKGGADFTRRHYFRHTPLYYAVQNQDETVVETLLIELRERFGPCALESIPEVTKDYLLHLAAYLNNGWIAGLLLDSGRDKSIDSVNEINDTPLHIASNFGSEDVAELLFMNGAEINPVNKYNHTPLYLACEQGHLNIIKLLFMAGAIIDKPPFPLHCAVNKGHVKVVEFLVSNGANVNLKDESLDHNTPLHLAVQSDDVEMVKCLLSSGLIDVNVSNAQHWTPLLLAKRCNNRRIREMVELRV